VAPIIIVVALTQKHGIDLQFDCENVNVVGGINLALTMVTVTL
jgi:hypothetical protein